MNSWNSWKTYKKHMEQKIEKIGIGLITCDRSDFFKKSYDSLIKATYQNPRFITIVINDGKDDADILSDQIYKKTTGYTGVAKSKNLALKYLAENGCDHLFLMEDDIEIINGNVFDEYINASKQTGIKHFNYGLHGNHNIGFDGQPSIKKTIVYPNKQTSIDLYSNVLGAFSYYHIDTINSVGLMDEKFYNAMEHVDHTYQIIKNNFHPPFRWFADITGSNKYLADIVPDHQNSKIRSQDNFQEVFKKGLDLFIKKNNFSVVRGYGPNEIVTEEKEVLKILKDIWTKHHQ